MFLSLRIKPKYSCTADKTPPSVRYSLKNDDMDLGLLMLFLYFSRPLTVCPVFRYLYSLLFYYSLMPGCDYSKFRLEIVSIVENLSWSSTLIIHLPFVITLASNCPVPPTDSI